MAMKHDGNAIIHNTGRSVSITLPNGGVVLVQGKPTEATYVPPIKGPAVTIEPGHTTAV